MTKRETHKTIDDVKQIVGHWLMQQKRWMPECSLQKGEKIRGTRHVKAPLGIQVM